MAAKLRKLRSGCGSVSICCVVTFVAISLVLVSTAWVPTTVIDSESVAVVSMPIFRSSTCPIRTVMS